MNTLIVIAATLLFAYTLILCVVNRGIPSSLSATVYALPPMGAWLWTIIIGAVAFLTMPTLLDMTPEMWQFLAFLCGAGLLAVAVCPLIPNKGDFTHTIHVAGAIASAVASQALIAILNQWLLLMWVPWLVAFVWCSKDHIWKQQMFWAEMVCFASTFTLCFVR